MPLTGTEYVIQKLYRVFQEQSATGEPMGEFTSQHLFAWLRNRGCSEEEASAIIKKVDEEEETTITTE